LVSDLRTFNKLWCIISVIILAPGAPVMLHPLNMSYYSWGARGGKKNYCTARLVACNLKNRDSAQTQPQNLSNFIKFGISMPRKCYQDYHLDSALPLKENPMVMAMKALGASLSLPTFVFPSSPSGLCQPAVNACRLLGRVDEN